MGDLINSNLHIETTGVGQTAPASEAPPTQEQQVQDSIETSKMLAALMFLESGHPMLVNPKTFDDYQEITIGDLAKIMSRIESDTINNILDGWTEHLKKQDKLIKEMINSPDYQQRLSQMFPDPAQRAQFMKEMDLSVGARASMGVAIASAAQSGAVSRDVAVMGLVGLMVGGAVGVLPGASSRVPLAATVAAVAGAQGNGIASLVGIFTKGVAIKSAMGGFVAGMHSGKPFNREAVSHDFARRTMQMLRDPGFIKGLVSPILRQAGIPAGMTEQQAGAMVSILLATNAVAALKLADEGWIGPMKSLLSGEEKLKLPPESLMNQLYLHIHAQLAVLTPSQREKLLESLDKALDEGYDPIELDKAERALATASLPSPEAPVRD